MEQRSNVIYKAYGMQLLRLRDLVVARGVKDKGEGGYFAGLRPCMRGSALFHGISLEGLT